MSQYPTIHRLFEAAETDQHSIQRAVDWLEEHGREWLAEAGTSQALRWQRRKSRRNWELKTVHQDRNPSAMEVAEQQAANEVIAQSNLVANRSNSLFCAGGVNDAFDDGHIMVLVPMGPFNYTWSPQVDDMNVWKRALEWNHGPFDAGDFARKLRDGSFNIEFKGDDGSLRSAIRSKHEIMIHPASGKVALFKEDFYQEVLKVMKP